MADPTVKVWAVEEVDMDGYMLGQPHLFTTEEVAREWMAEYAEFRRADRPDYDPTRLEVVEYEVAGSVDEATMKRPQNPWTGEPAA